MWAYQLKSKTEVEGSRENILGLYASQAGALEKLSCLQDEERKRQEQSTKCHFCPLYYKTSNYEERKTNNAEAAQYCEKFKVDTNYYCLHYCPQGQKNKYYIEAVPIIE